MSLFLMTLFIASPGVKLWNYYQKFTIMHLANLLRLIRMLTAGWSVGNSFIPIAFSLLSSQNDKYRINDIKENIDKRTNGYQRRKEALQKTTVTMFNLL